MIDPHITAITKAKGRKYLYHFTRARNLPTIAHFDALLSSHHLDPIAAGERRTALKEVQYENLPIIINAHLRIPESMMDPATTLEQFRACIDRHIFFWPTLRDCQKMLEMYSRREPEEKFAVLKCDATSLLLDHRAYVRLSKYDSGSSPRFPQHCTYRKSEAMFLPLHQFQHIRTNLVPTKASEIKEVLIEGKVSNLSAYVVAVYSDDEQLIHERWRNVVKPLQDLRPSDKKATNNPS